MDMITSENLAPKDIGQKNIDHDNIGYGTAKDFAAHHADKFLKIDKNSPAGNATSPLWLDWIETPIGPMLAICDNTHLFMLEFTARKALQSQFEQFYKRHERPIHLGRTIMTDKITNEINAYFAGQLRQFTTPFMPMGTEFQKNVWQQLCQIPYGQTRSYSQLAQMTGRPKAVRAAASANARNGLALIIPCHRVISRSGELGGYAGGVSRKAALLALES